MVPQTSTLQAQSSASPTPSPQPSPPSTALANNPTPGQEANSANQARCRDWLAWALETLEAPASALLLDSLSELIWSTVTGRGRLFHNAEHILHLAEGDDPLCTLAALFHDSIYVQVDWGLAPEVQAHLTPFLVWHGGALCLRPAAELRRIADSACASLLFGLDHGEPQPAERFNEFLSALLAVQCLKPLLPQATLAELVVAIEASIPFRSTAQYVPSEQLYKRLSLANQRFELGLSPGEVEQAIHRAVAFANRDVGSFSIADPVIFLDQTWRLLPELTPALRNPGQYSIQDYRTACAGWKAF